MFKKHIPQAEFVALMASLMATVALAIDAILPALDIIGFSVGSVSDAENQQIIIMIFLGLGIGPLIFGPVSDAIGRKPVVYMGFFLFIISSFICVYAQSMTALLIGRIIQGIALSAPRTISIAIIRDTYSGDHMARIMSFVTVVFLLIPVIAPALGKLILDAYNWQSIFYVQIVFAVFVGIWFWKRQPETLREENTVKFTPNIFTNGIRELVKHKQTMGYTFISGLIVGAFLVYLSTAQQVFEVQYHLKDEFPYIFAGLAISIGIATFLNGSFVLRFGMKKLITVFLISFFMISLLYVVLFFGKSNPSIEILVAFLAAQFFCISFLFGNLRSAAMQPIGHIAGIGAAITGFIGTLMSVPISTYIGSFVTHSVLPMFMGFTVCAFIALLILGYLKLADRKTIAAAL
jgi:DHA1 family bicyclomycin/chloramphenicol resistance-like MFS transporter